LSPVAARLVSGKLGVGKDICGRAHERLHFRGVVMGQPHQRGLRRRKVADRNARDPGVTLVLEERARGGMDPLAERDAHHHYLRVTIDDPPQDAPASG
jgi:hypothetical protein